MCNLWTEETNLQSHWMTYRMIAQALQHTILAPFHPQPFKMTGHISLSLTDPITTNDSNKQKDRDLKPMQRNTLFTN